MNETECTIVASSETARISHKSIEGILAAIKRFNHEIVAIELDPSRFAALKKQAQNSLVNDVLGVKNFNSLLVQWLPAFLPRKIGVGVGIEL